MKENLKFQITKIASGGFGKFDNWDLKQYVLCLLFYRFISEDFLKYIHNNNITREKAIKEKGYYIGDGQLFANVVKNANNNDNLNLELAQIFSEIENSANGYPSEKNIKGIFDDFIKITERSKEKNSVKTILKGIASIDLDTKDVDLLGDAYEFIMGQYASNARGIGGEFFTPQSVSKLIAQLAMHKQTRVNKIYDPACGSGSLLLQAKKYFDSHIIEDGFFGQELNHTTYNLARMNMFLHNINYDKFDIGLGDTLLHPHFGNEKPFDAIVSNPPYSVKWIGADDPTLINDDRFAPAGVLAPKSKADFAFVLHALSYLSSKGRAVIVCFPGIFYRGGAEQKIRQYLVDNNYVETVISLAPNLFYGTSIAVNILVLAKNKNDMNVQFIDASSFYKKETNNNVLLDEHIERIIELFDKKENIEHMAESVPYEKIVENDYNLSVSSYVQSKDTSEVIDIIQLNAQIKSTVSKIDKLRMEIDAIMDEIEG